MHSLLQPWPIDQRHSFNGVDIVEILSSGNVSNVYDAERSQTFMKRIAEQIGEIVMPVHIQCFHFR